ncbi:hypothetical protein Fot_20700 [Forsythia ovata]|uniref:Uncharacterized protein n=1 Tax=Forsythia ovata TaxID=205694 RepID=A0ABD1USQ9_9LAMI
MDTEQALIKVTDSSQLELDKPDEDHHRAKRRDLGVIDNLNDYDQEMLLSFAIDNFLQGDTYYYEIRKSTVPCKQKPLLDLLVSLHNFGVLMVVKANYFRDLRRPFE